MKIKSIMTKPVISIKRTSSIKEVVKKMTAKKIGSIIVVEKKIPIGIFTKNDLVRALADDIDFSKTTVETVMRTPVLPVNENEKFLHAARRMRQFDIRHFIVVNNAGALVGVVTDMDIVKNYALTYLSYQTTIVASGFDGLSAPPSTQLKKIAQMMLDGRKASVVIVKNKKPIGIINEALLVKLGARYKDPLKFRAVDKMVKKFCGAKPEDSMRGAVLNMIKKDLRNIVLTDEKGRFDGVVSLRELVTYIINQQL